jgi:hypothetical protein
LSPRCNYFHCCRCPFVNDSDNDSDSFAHFVFSSILLRFYQAIESKLQRAASDEAADRHRLLLLNRHSRGDLLLQLLLDTRDEAAP